MTLKIIMFSILALCLLALLSVGSDLPAKVLLYHNDRSLEYQTDFLCRSRMFKKTKCSIDQTYKMITIGKDSAKLSAIVVCNVHARELIASQLCLRFMKSLRYDKSHQLLGYIQFRVFYRANNQRDRVINGEYCLRTNKNGVDINRNFPTGFKEFEANAQTNPGSEPISEPFSKCIDSEVDRKKPDIYLDIHSGQETFYYQDGVNSKKQLGVIRQLKKKLCKNCRIKNDDPEGEIYSDMKIRRKIRYSNLFEVYGSYNQLQTQVDNCFTIFNPQTQLSKEFYLQKWNQIIREYFRGIVNAEGIASKLTHKLRPI